MASGYLFAKYDLFETFLDRIAGRFQHTSGKVLFWMLLILAAMKGRYYCQYLHFGTMEIRGGMFTVQYTADITYAPMFVYGCARLLQYIRKTPVSRILEETGRKSMLMWFFHCAFFNVLREYTQPVLYWPKNPVLVTAWGLILCYVLSAIADPVIQKLLQAKNRILNRILQLQRSGFLSK